METPIFHSLSPAKSKVFCTGHGGVVLALGGREYSRKEALRRVDLELARGNEREAVSLVLSLQGRPGGLRGFGAAKQVPQRLYTLEELRLNKVDTTRLLSPVDRTLGSVRKNIQLAAIIGGIAAWNILSLKQLQLLSIVLALIALGTIDQVVYGGGGEALLVDTIGRLLSQKYRNRVAQTLNKYSCIALAGVATEYLLFGSAEGGLADIQQLDNLLKNLSFTPKKADSLVRWSVLNTVTLLRRHKQVHSKLAEAMSFGRSVGECIDTIEDELMNAVDI